MNIPDTIVGWQCIGCGRVDAPQPCIGVCQDRKVELVAAGDYLQLIGSGRPKPPRPPNRTCGSPAYGSPVGGFFIGIGSPLAGLRSR